MLIFAPFLLPGSRGHNALPHPGKTVKLIWLWAVEGGAFIVFGTVEAGCTSSAMPCYCLCSRSRLALPQLEDNAKLCLTKTFSPPLLLLFFFFFLCSPSVFFLFYYSAVCTALSQKVVICCIIKKKR